MAVLYSKRNGNAVLHFTANATVTVVGNNSVSGLAANGSTEVVSGASINKIAWGVSGTGTWTVKRGANTVLVLTNSNTLNMDEFGAAISLYPDATLVVELSGGTGHIMLDITKSFSALDEAANRGF